MSYYNPFRKIKENNTYVLSKFFRNNFLQKIKDLFYMIAGSFFESKRRHVGLFDYVTLMIPHRFNRITLWSLSEAKKNIFAGLVLVPSLIITLSLAIVRYSLAAALSALFLPLVFISHLISKVRGDKLKSKILQVPVIVCDSKLKNSLDNGSLSWEKRVAFIRKKYEEKSTLGEYLKASNCCLEDLDIECEGTYTRLKMEFNKKELSPNSDDLIAYAELSFEEESKKSSENFQAIIALNIGDISRKLEKQTSLNNFFSKHKEERKFDWFDTKVSPRCFF